MVAMATMWLRQMGGAPTFSISWAVHVFVYALVCAVIFAILYYVVARSPIPDPFKTWLLYLLYVLAAIVVIIFLLSLVGVGPG